MKNQRTYWIDIAKGIGIICVVLGHMNIPSIAIQFLYSFHMPLFFFLSGCVFKKIDTVDFKTFSCKIMSNLLIPYFYFGVVTIVAMTIINPNMDDTMNISLNFLMGNGSGTPLWFLTCLFVTECIFYIIISIINNNMKHCGIVLFLFSLIGYTLSYYGIKLIWEIDVAFTGVVFLGIGYMSKSFIKMYKQKSIKVKMITFICSGFFSIFFCFINTGRVDLLQNITGNYLCFYISACSGIFSVILLSQLVKSSVIVFLGKNTLIIMSIHTLIPVLLLNITSSLLNKSISQINSISVLKNGNRVLSLVMIYISIIIINKYFIFMLGKKKLNIGFKSKVSSST